MLASALALLAMLFARRASVNTEVVGYLFTGGLVVLLPLLLITPAADWRYLMAANVFWISSVLIAAATFASRGDAD